MRPQPRYHSNKKGKTLEGRLNKKCARVIKKELKTTLKVVNKALSKWKCLACF